MGLASGQHPDTDEFGYIPFSFRAECGDFVVEALPDLNERVEAVETNSNRDGFWYPPEVRSYSSDVDFTEETEIPRSARPALLHRLPPTHAIHHRSGAPLPPAFRDREGAMLINLLALLYRTRCQFWDWFFDMRVRIAKGRVASFSDSDRTVSSVLTRVLTTWNGWSNEKTQLLFSNALWIHCRAPSYEWDWERFFVRYMTLDAAWAVVSRLYGLPNPPHPDRIAIMCDRFGLYQHPEQAAEFSRLRRELFHEALWDKDRPGTATSASAYMADIHLGHLNERLLLAIGGVRGGFVRNNWLSFSASSFDFE